MLDRRVEGVDDLTSLDCRELLAVENAVDGGAERDVRQVRPSTLSASPIHRGHQLVEPRLDRVDSRVSEPAAVRVVESVRVVVRARGLHLELPRQFRDRVADAGLYPAGAHLERLVGPGTIGRDPAAYPRPPLEDGHFEALVHEVPCRGDAGYSGAYHENPRAGPAGRRASGCGRKERDASSEREQAREVSSRDCLLHLGPLWRGGRIVPLREIVGRCLRDDRRWQRARDIARPRHGSTMNPGGELHDNRTQ